MAPSTMIARRMLAKRVGMNQYLRVANFSSGTARPTTAALLNSALKSSSSSSVSSLSVPAAKLSTFNPSSLREYSTGNNSYNISDLSPADYGVISDESMEYLNDFLEEFIEDHVKDLSDWDVEYDSGVLTLKTGETGTYVINKQPPNKQIWLSSPISGPKRYDYDADSKVWFYTRDNSLLADLLSEELSTLSHRKVDLDGSLS